MVKHLKRKDFWSFWEERGGSMERDHKIEIWWSGVVVSCKDKWKSSFKTMRHIQIMCDRACCKQKERFLYFLSIWFFLVPFGLHRKVWIRSLEKERSSPMKIGPLSHCMVHIWKSSSARAQLSWLCGGGGISNFSALWKFSWLTKT